MKIYMTSLQKETIKQLRESGFSYKAISEQTGISSETIRSFLRRNSIDVQKTSLATCLNCGKHIKSSAGKKQKKFCSRECGLMWWHQHTALINKKAIYTFTCQACGKQFTTYGQSKRKYCCHQCYINARFNGGSYAS